MIVKREKAITIEVGESKGKMRNEKRFNVERQFGSVFTASLRDFRRGYFPGLTSSGDLSLKLSADSAGRTISLFPVNAAPPPPPPPPAPAPIAAPFPPPAMSPINAPRAAPPPATAHARVPFPLL